METCWKARSLDLPVICEIITYWSHAQAKQLWLWLCQLWIDSSQADILTDKQTGGQTGSLICLDCWSTTNAAASDSGTPWTERLCSAHVCQQKRESERGWEWEWGRDTDIDGMWIKLLGGWMSEATPKHRFRNQFNSYGVARQQTAKMKKLRRRRRGRLRLPLGLQLAVTMSRKTPTKQRGINRNRTPFSSVWQAKQSVRFYEQLALAVGKKAIKSVLKRRSQKSLYYIYASVRAI